MKNRFSLSTRRLRSVSVIISTVVLFLIIGFTGSLVPLIAPVTSTLTAFATNVSSTLLRVWSTKSITPQELEALQQERVRFAVDRSAYEQCKLENEQLQEQLAFTSRQDHAMVSARILSKNITETGARFVIDVGEQQGVIVGSAVVVGDGILIGKVIKTESRFSTVASVTDPSSVVAVSLLNEQETIGITYGLIGGLLRIQYIPLEEHISVSDLVVTSGLEETVPSGLLVGVVNAVLEEPGSAFQEALIEPLGDMRRVTHVTVLLPYE